MQGLNLNSLISQFGGMQGIAQRMMSTFMKNNLPLNKDYVKQQLKGKSFSNDTIEQFRQIAHSQGFSDTVIDSTLKEVGIL